MIIVTEFRYTIYMNFKEYLSKTGISAYRLAKMANVAYSCIADLCLNKTTTRNLTLEKACRISSALGITPEKLLEFKTETDLPMRYFRNNVLHDLKRMGNESFINKTLRKREIDGYYKNGDMPKALYLLALIDYLCLLTNRPIYTKRYNQLRKLCLDKPCFVGSDLIHYASIEEAEKALGKAVIPEFAKYNIIETNINDIA